MSTVPKKVIVNAIPSFLAIMDITFDDLCNSDVWKDVFANYIALGATRSQ